MADEIWTDDPQEADAVAKYFSLAHAVVPPKLPAECPVCSAVALHVLFMRREDGRPIGGGWAWCSSCRTHVHDRLLIPQWWTEPNFELDSTLTGMDGLDMFAVELDAHWNECVRIYFGHAGE